MTLQGLRTVIYKVSDLTKAKSWYSNTFGIQPYFDQPFYVGFNVGGFELGLDPDMTGVAAGNRHLAYWGVADLAKTLTALAKEGVNPKTPARDVGDGIKVASVLDPFGNEIGLIENPHFSLK